MGSVYEGTDRRDRTPVAVKLLHPHLTSEEAFRERFQREAHVGALLRSPYSVHILDYGTQDDQYYIVMEYVDGQTLRALMRPGPLPPKRALKIAVQVARALEEAQARGVVHRDIKPENIMLLADDSVKVTDFGIARQIGAGTLTVPGAFIGTVAYAAPEQFMGKADHRADVYSLGATLYDMLAGRAPFGGTLEEMLRAIRESPPDMDALAGFAPSVIDAVGRCLEKDPDARFQSASEAAAAFEEAMKPGTQALTVSTPAPAPAPALAANHPSQYVTSGTAATQPGEPAITLGLRPHKPMPLIGGRLNASRFDVLVTNYGQGPATVLLEASAENGNCRLKRSSPLAVMAGETKTVGLTVSPKVRRWRGDPLSHRIAVSAAAGGGAPPVEVRTQFEDRPYGWLPYGAGVGGALVLGAILLGLFTAGGSSATGITEDQLPGLVLSQADLGPSYAGLQSDPGQVWRFHERQPDRASLRR